MQRAFLVIALLIVPGMSVAQHAQPYAGLQERPIKALSAEQIADLKAGRGMGLALAAELNGYPGPVHVVELADKLELADAQRARIEDLLTSMKTETVPLGERLIEQEADLDRQFAERRITEADLAVATDAIGSIQAALRAAHLRYHLLTVEVLTPAQTRRYGELRGYGGSDAAGHQHGGHMQSH